MRPKLPRRFERVARLDDARFRVRSVLREEGPILKAQQSPVSGTSRFLRAAEPVSATPPYHRA